MLLQDLCQLGIKFRHGLEKIGDKAEIRHLEDGGFIVLIDGDDDLGILHAGEMLDGA